MQTTQAHDPRASRALRRSRITLLAACAALACALLSASCSSSKPKPARPAIDLRRLNLELRRDLVHAGGAQIWIRNFPKDGRSEDGDSIPDVLATPGAYERVISTLAGAAAQHGMQILERPNENDAKNVEIHLKASDQPDLVWRVREVPRLLRAAIIIDDLGQDREAADRLLAMAYPLTFSVLPDLPHSEHVADAAFRKGREVMLHLPMEPEPGATSLPGPGEIKVGMSSGEVARMVEEDLDAVPHVRGVNNHMGSRATADPALMAAVMSVLAKRKLYFVDSRTTASSTGLVVARRMGVPAFYRSVFLDDTETVPYTLGQLRQFRRAIEEKGAAIAIGHPHRTTIEALAEFLPQLERDGIQLVPASELVRLPEVAELAPSAARN